MKKNLFIFCMTLITSAGVFTNKVKATAATPICQILVTPCYDSQNQVSGTGNTCTKGSGNCIANPCNN